MFKLLTSQHRKRKCCGASVAIFHNAATTLPSLVHARVGITQAAELQAASWDPPRKGSEGEVFDVRRPPGDEDDGIVAPGYSMLQQCA